MFRFFKKEVSMRMFVWVTAFFIFADCKAEKKTEVKKEIKRHIVMVIANKNFRDEEFEIPYDIFKEKGFSVKIASNDTTPAQGMLGAKVKPDILIKDINSTDYDAIVLVGGSGSTILWEDTALQRIVRKFYKEGKIIGAICLSPVVLAKAGILKGKRATCFPTAKEELKKGGAEYIEAMLSTDGNIITASGPQAARIYAETIVSFLKAKK